jgi:peptide/nickel transport system permease protein
MGAIIITRLCGGLAVLVVVSALAFGLQELTPGDPARLLLQASGLNPVPEEAVAAKRREMRLDEPLPVRYLDWLARAAQGDLGRSYRSYTPVLDLYAERLPATATLAMLSVLLALGIALPLGALAAYYRGGFFDSLAQALVVLGGAVPGFWLALVAIYLFAATLRWLPAFGSLTPTGIILPATVLALHNAALLTRLTRAALLDVLGRDFIVVARAKGVPGPTIARRHVLPNVLTPILTVVGLEVAGLMTGAAVVEYVFAWPGIGKLAVDAALIGDIPIIVGFAMLAGLVFVVLNIIVDIGVAALDPRLRSTG